MHSSIIKVGSRLEACALDETLFTCPLCPKLKTSAKKMNGHMEGHINMAVHFKDKILCRCNLLCRRLPHYHCPYCLRTIIKMKDAEIHVKACYSKTTSLSPSIGLLPLPQPPVMTQTMLLQDHNYALEKEHCMPAADSLLSPTVPDAVTLMPPAVTLEPPSLPDAEMLTPLRSLGIDPECPHSLVSQNVFPVMQDHDYLQNSTLMSENSSVSPEALDLRSSRVKYLKVVKCPHCALVLYKKNLATHIQRKHKKTKDNTATYHLKCVCVDETHGEYAVQKEDCQSFSVPVHVQHKTDTKREAVECGQSQLLALKGGLSSLCEHIQSLDSCANTATENFLKAEVLEEMLAFREILNSHLRPLKDLVK